MEARLGVRWVNASLVGAVLAVLAAVAVLLPATASAAENVTTAGYSNLRDNWDSHEPGLEPAALQASTFGRRFKTKLEGSIYAQPLIYEGHVIVTTEKANAYAVNATTGAVIWKRNFGKPFTSKAIGCSDLTPNLGSTSTPVIDPSTGTIYMTTRIFEGGNQVNNGVWYLQAISAATGEERPGYPVKISGTPYNTPEIPFNEHYAQQRPGLLLMNGVVYIAFASNCDITPYRGIVVGVNASTRSMTTMWSTESGPGSDESSEAGIWQGGGGLVSNESGHIILATGNGLSPTKAASNNPPETLSESVVGLQVEPSGELKPKQFFSPHDAVSLDQADEDLGSGGPIALPTEPFGTPTYPHLIVQVGKDGRIFLLDSSNLGGYRQGAGEGDAVLQTVGPYGGVWGHPAAYGGQGGYVYVLESAGGGQLRAFSSGRTGEGKPILVPAGASAESFGYTSGSPLVTSNGTAAGSPVVWGVYLSGPDGHEAQLRAYSGAPQGGQLPLLWMAKIGIGSKFSTPTAYEGRVYVGNRQGVLYGFGSSTAAQLQARPVHLGAVAVHHSRTVTLTLSSRSNIKLTGPVTVSGDVSVSATEPPPTPTVKTPTAGPSKLLPSGVAPLPRGVVNVSQPRAGLALRPGGHLRLRLRFTPKHAGPVIGFVTLRTSIGYRDFVFTGYATRPGLLVSARPLHFGFLRTGAGATRTISLTLSNSWNRPERITGFDLPRGPFHVTGLPATGTVLRPRQAVSIAVTFAPHRRGTFRSILRAHTSHGSVALPTTGVAVTGHPRLVIEPLQISFGDVKVGGSATRTFTLHDGGDVPVEITRVIEPEEPFTAPVPLPAGITIEPGAVAHVTVRFAPVATGPVSGTYVINSTDGHGYYRVQLSGNGT